MEELSSRTCVIAHSKQQFQQVYTRHASQKHSAFRASLKGRTHCQKPAAPPAQSLHFHFGWETGKIQT